MDSGLPDFQEPEGFWRAYPPLQKLGLSFADMAQPHWFESNPSWPGHFTVIDGSYTARHLPMLATRCFGAGGS